MIPEADPAQLEHDSEESAYWTSIDTLDRKVRT